MLVVVLLSLAGGSALAGDKNKKEEDKPDHLALAALLVCDGHLERAEVELSQVDLQDETVDKVQYWKLKGVIALQRKQWGPAAKAFEGAIAAGATDKLLYVYIAQSYYQTQEWAKSIAALDKAGKAQLDALPKLLLLKAQALVKLKRPNDAYKVLLDVERRHPAVRTEATRLKVYLLIERGLYRSAAEAGRAYLERPGATASDHVALAEALRRGRAFDEAVQLLEVARMRFANDPNVLVGLARTYADQRKSVVAAGLFERASFLERDPKKIDAHSLAAAELYRRSGRLRQAMLVNGRLNDQKAKVRQRMGLLVESQQFESAAALAPRIVRLRLDKDDAVVYAVAFAYFRTQRYKKAELWLKKLRSADMFEKAADLRKIMEGCRTGRIPCD